MITIFTELKKGKHLLQWFLSPLLKINEHDKVLLLLLHPKMLLCNKIRICYPESYYELNHAQVQCSLNHHHSLTEPTKSSTGPENSQFHTLHIKWRLMHFILIKVLLSAFWTFTQWAAVTSPESNSWITHNGLWGLNMLNHVCLTFKVFKVNSDYIQAFETLFTIFVHIPAASILYNAP